MGTLVGLLTAGVLQILAALRQNMLATQENRLAIEALGHSVDGVKTELVAATRLAALSEGRDMQRDKQEAKAEAAVAAGEGPMLSGTGPISVESITAKTIVAEKLEAGPKDK